MDWFTVVSTPTTKRAHGPVDERQEIDTREGTVVAEPGDYIIEEEYGNRYPISGEKFEEYYRRPNEDNGKWMCDFCGEGRGTATKRNGVVMCFGCGLKAGRMGLAFSEGDNGR